MVEYSKVNVKLTDTKLKNLKTAVKKNRVDFKDDFKNAWWKSSTAWITVDNKTKKEAKKCI